MSEFQVITLILTVMTLLFLPMLGLLFRITIKWTKIEAKIGELTDDMSKLVADKDKTHKDMLEQMREDRNATNTRLRWLEETLWGRSGGKGKHNAL